MNRLIEIPLNEADWHDKRRKVLTSTDIPALFNVSPYQSYEKLWNLKRCGLVAQRKINPSMARGNDREWALVQKIALERKWHVEPMKEFIQLPDYRMGASYDAARIDIPYANTKTPFEAKTAHYMVFNRGYWKKEGKNFKRGSLYIEWQMQTQLFVAGKDHMYVGCEIGYPHPETKLWISTEIIVGFRQASPVCQQMMLDAGGKFWKSIKEDTPPHGVRVLKRYEKLVARVA